MIMVNCPCCSNPLIRQIHAHQTVWFCRHCWQEMPVLDADMATHHCSFQHSSVSTVESQGAYRKIGTEIVRLDDSGKLFAAKDL
ncbi:hypothetical protein [Oculatella sp. LEGE 06141]|uniref:hypothetical protein n=1 Tax=Oculatella sp. LEGE 06141 TaxID=1828648 RepID=UPI00187E3B0D|nr:hypothetical protein [Oculatella sp. LEGE 06141]